MNFIGNIKLNYYKNLIKDLLLNSETLSLKKELDLLHKKNKSLFYQINKIFFSDILHLSITSEIFYQNTIYINSYNKSDINLINNFLKFYFNQHGFNNFNYSNYENEFINIDKVIKNRKSLTLENFLEDSILYQLIMNLKNKNDIAVLKNQFAFFSTENGYNFTHPSLTRCYFIIIDHPYELYKYIKSKNKNNINFSLNLLFNQDSRQECLLIDDVNIEIFKKDWLTHTLSWCDPNLVSSLKGFIINKNELFKDPMEIFTSIILHLRQCQLNVPLDYKIIEDYVSKIDFKPAQLPDISNKEKKFINKHSEKITEVLDFNFD